MTKAEFYRHPVPLTRGGARTQLDAMPAGLLSGGMSKPAAPFWKTKSLGEMNAKEWESLCDGCGRCCLIKLEDEDTREYYFTDVACRLFDVGLCRCRDYANRDREVPDCVRLTPENVGGLGWMPPSCAYRLLAEGRDLPDWHPLVTGRAESTAEAGASVAGRIHALEDEISLEGLVRRIRKWPGRWPRAPGREIPDIKVKNPK